MSGTEGPAHYRDLQGVICVCTRRSFDACTNWKPILGDKSLGTGIGRGFGVHKRVEKCVQYAHVESDTHASICYIYGFLIMHVSGSDRAKKIRLKL